MDIQDKMGNRTRHFLIGSFTLLLVISASAFLCLGYYMSNVSRKAIDKVGSLYMEGINKQISAHFRTLMTLKLEQAETVVEVVSANHDNANELYEELIYRIHVRNFNYLALCSESGDLEMLYGEPIYLADPEPFFESLENNEKKIAIGKDESGNEVVLFGINADYPMKNGEQCMALIAALPIEYISEMLDTDEVDELVYTHIIRKDGSFISSALSNDYSDYFSSLYERYPEDSRETIDAYIEALTTAMQNKEDYSAILELGGNRELIYSTLLPYSEWHLIIVLPFGPLNQTVENLNLNTTAATILVFALILLMLLFIFYIYYKLSCQQLIALDAARQEALLANKAKSEFLSNMSHDIRTPMNAIVGMTAIATTHIDDIEHVQHCLKKIALSGKHLLGLINDVLDMSKIESGKLTLTAERISLREISDALVSIVQPQIKNKNQNFNVHIDNIIAEDVYCDSVRLNQILLNLLSNAIKYTQEGGTVQLSLYQEDITLPEKENYVRTHIKVKDNGIGMAPEFIERIFDSYSRADSKRVQKTEGAGLGMAITKYIVNAMNGTITVESTLNKGTEFHVILDLEKALGQEMDMLLPPWKILVVDDDEMLCRTAIETLESIGIHADWTQSGNKAIQMVTAHHQMHDEYQIVLLDWKLPEQDGITIAKQMLQITDIPIILISAYDWGEFEAEAKAAGITGFISKPLFKSTLFYGLKKYMNISEAQDSSNVDMDLAGHNILVAEDNDLNWEILSELLSDFGLKLDWAENGQICFEMFKSSEPGYYAAILMDIRMPVMNGIEATLAIRASDHQDAQSIPIIAMTADAFSEDVQRCLDSGMNAHTAKPVNLDEVLSLLKKFILNH
ncbi:hybrid sensor histidine kinase/response regulator [Parablautia muri]|uniref:Stage 0 sporulation protein A homolog n=1 Tax=Parablautia muri TaxID=2320879 RepID=A0A9X5BG05_9FIRM|nr:response regulator [Parablautia muri]NBJ92452.1 response regulator [Parablautia muri]